MNKRLKNLTDKQIFILEQVADGKSDGEIAKELEYSIGNIRRHIDKMLVIFMWHTEPPSLLRRLEIRLLSK